MSDSAALEAELDLHLAAGDMEQVAVVIDKLGRRLDGDFQRGAFFHAMAIRLREQLGDAEVAFDHFGYALDMWFQRPETVTAETLPVAMAPFETIVQILTARGDTRNVEREHRKMLYRLRGGPHRELQVTLWETLAAHYRSIGSDDAAAAALEQAQQLRSA